MMKFKEKSPMFRAIIAAAAIVLAALPSAAQTRVGEVSTTFRLIGPNDKVTVDRYDDPKVEGVSCYLSRAETGGIGGALGIAEDPSRFSIACRATGTIRIHGDIDRSRNGEVVFGERTSALFKELRVTRFFDAERNVLVYLVWSTRLINGSPFNSVTAIAMNGTPQ
jgi:CreA protein